MNTSQSKYAQMQIKLEEGLRILESTIEEDDPFTLNAALIKLHGAMEDFVRLEVARKAPHLRDTVEDLRNTNWKTLLDLGRTYLKFTQKDCDIINEANVYRSKVAHGGNYEKKLSDLKKYARFVEKWIKRASAPAEDEWGGGQVIEQKSPTQPKRQPEYKPVDQPPAVRQREQRADGYASGKPWYRSTFFLFFAFFFLTPIWIILIVTDRNQGFFPKLIAYSMILMICAFTLLFIPYGYPAFEALQEIFEQPGLQATPAQTPSNIQAQVTASPLPAATAPGSITETACTIVWVEHTADDLGGRSRSMVWDEIVALQVQGSGMTASQFYDLVVEQNPDLIQDGYEFKKGKVYLLPECN
jgi:hypothetical protein